jgi:hypothetical protein
MTENDLVKMMVFNEVNSPHPIGVARSFIIDELSDVKLYFEDIQSRTPGVLRAFGRVFVSESCHREIIPASDLIDDSKWRLSLLDTVNCLKNEIQYLQDSLNRTNRMLM